MNPEAVKSFVTHYIFALNERTRREKTGTKWGLDWVIYNIGLAKYGKPVRLPFIRAGGLDYGKSKVEAEFGIDLSFVSDDQRSLVIFVLKDEPLTNKKWTGNDFDRDLRMALSPDLTAEGLGQVVEVTIVLAYNKDDEQNGVLLYERFVAAAPPKLGESVSLELVRWNLSDIVKETIEHVLSPSLVPEKFFGQLSYLSAQVADFVHGSDPWNNQLVPNWRRFVSDVLGENDDTRGRALVPVALIILREHAKNNASFATGWIDLIEWAAIALWNRYVSAGDPAMLSDVSRFWTSFYIVEVDALYRDHIGALTTENAIDQMAHASCVGCVAAGWCAFWHIGRLGLLSLHLSTEQERREERLREVADWISMLLNANASAYRPLLDIHHIELYLLAEAFRNAGRVDEFATYASNLEVRLYLRRLAASQLPFLDGGNSLKNVFEQAATAPPDSLLLTQSSYFLLCLLELCCLLPVELRDELLVVIHRRLVLGAFDEGGGERTPLDLMSWLPPNDWALKVFGNAIDGGEAISVGHLADSPDASAGDLIGSLERVVSEMRKVQAFALPDNIPLAALVLGSLRFQSPLPTELWRRNAFPAPVPKKV